MKASFNSAAQLFSSDARGRARRYRAITINLLIPVALLGGLAWLYAKTRSVDFDAHNDTIGNLRQLKQIDAEWNIDVFKSKMGINNNYDPVAQPLPLIRTLQANLAARTGSSGDAQGPLARLQQFQAVMAQKIVLIERFKSQNAIYRNSTHFLPTAYEEAMATAKRSGVVGSKLADLEATVTPIFTEALAYNLTPDAVLKAKLAAQLDSARRRAEAYPTELQGAFNVLLAHIGTTLRQQDIGTGLLNDLSRLPTATMIDALADSYGRAHEQRLLAQQYYRQLLIAYSIVLLLLLSYVAWRLLRSYRRLGEMNTALNQANLDLRESQVQLVQSEKMSALGQMVAGIAHEINTPLAYVKGTLELLKDRMGLVHELASSSDRFTATMNTGATVEPGRATKLAECYLKAAAASRAISESHRLQEIDTMIDDGSHGIGQITEIVHSLKNFSRLDRAQVSDYPLSDGLASTLIIAKHQLKDLIKVETDFGQNVPAVTCSPSQINQVFLNIITNAAQAMSARGGGKLQIRVERGDADTVRVEISDDGGGIPSAVLPKIFDPFFTTKPVGVGTGMGLSISYKIIEAHGGKILVDTEPGIGTCFTILLPVKQKASSEVAPLFAD